MESKQLGPGFAAEILGVDLSAAMSDGDFDAIKKLWLENKVTVFRDQELSDNELTRFTERFGPLFVHVRSQFNDKTRPGIMLISNIKENGRDLGELGNGDLAWHSDQSYFRRTGLCHPDLRHRNSDKRRWHMVLRYGARLRKPAGSDESADRWSKAKLLYRGDGGNAARRTDGKAAPIETARHAPLGANSSGARTKISLSQPGP